MFEAPGVPGSQRTAAPVGIEKKWVHQRCAALRPGHVAYRLPYAILLEENGAVCRASAMRPIAREAFELHQVRSIVLIMNPMAGQLPAARVMMGRHRRLITVVFA